MRNKYQILRKDYFHLVFLFTTNRTLHSVIKQISHLENLKLEFLIIRLYKSLLQIPEI